MKNVLFICIVLCLCIFAANIASADEYIRILWATHGENVLLIIPKKLTADEFSKIRIRDWSNNAPKDSRDYSAAYASTGEIAFIVPRKILTGRFNIMTIDKSGKINYLPGPPLGSFKIIQ